jgi:hypothetical protein
MTKIPLHYKELDTNKLEMIRFNFNEAVRNTLMSCLHTIDCPHLFHLKPKELKINFLF